MESLTSDAWPALIDDFLAKARKPLIVILGPTASGKTAFSIDVAQHIGSCAIINADSRQLYKHLNVGTAKITEAEKEGIDHRLFDILDPAVDVSVAEYKKMATEEIDDCHARGIVPILVGGSMLYISAVVDGLDPLPPADPAVRERLEREWDADDGWTLYDKLVSVDPATAKSFEKQNKRYVVRAMELYEMTGKPPSTLKKTIPPPYDILMLGVRRERGELTNRIDERTAKLLRSGWIEEVEGLIDRGYTVQTPAMKSHGYREIMQWLASETKSIDELEAVIAAKTRQYAKRQMTWWEGDERIRWIEL